MEVSEAESWEPSSNNLLPIARDIRAEPFGPPLARPRAEGKFLFAGDEKLLVRGVTYGTFSTDESGAEQYCPKVVERDFAQMARNGFNAVRTYTVPPRWLLDKAALHGLRVMAGLPWEQHISFLDDRRRVENIVARVREGARQCAGHQALLCLAIGNEVPAPIVRWHGAHRIEKFLERLYHVVKQEDPDALVTYVNYPTTEYLDLSFCDLLCFNVYLERRETLASYVTRLHNIAGERPLVMAEVGLDSRRNGLEKQAEALSWQVRTAFENACSGAFVFAWTDEWHRGGQEIDDWDFGLTTRSRFPKPALAAMREAFAELPFSAAFSWPKVSVVLCSYNGARTIRESLEHLQRLDYPDYEIIVVDDGSKDETAAIASRFDVRLIRTENRGLSNARNTGMYAARGEIVAYIDDDAYPDPDWLRYLARHFEGTNHAAVGGPNIAPAGDGPIAACVANAPGGPSHVLRTDDVADHIPGCNMAFRKDILQAIGSFDPRFTAAGDDVDICWRLQDAGWTVGFCPGAVVWHHRRNEISHYWKQQRGYGKAEALLQEKWPNRYNRAGHIAWAGRVYGNGLTQPLPFYRPRIYQGTWGSAPFQALYKPATGLVVLLPLMPEWYLAIGVLAALGMLSLAWPPLALVALPLLALALAAPLVQAGVSARNARFREEDLPEFNLMKLRAITAVLHLLQPMARMLGRWRHGLVPWRRLPDWRVPWPFVKAIWCERWADTIDRLTELESTLQAAHAPTARGGDYDAWDLSVRGGLLGSARVCMAVEEHGTGRQLLRFRIRPVPSSAAIVLVVLLGGAAAGAAADGALVVAAVLGAGALWTAVQTVAVSGSAQAAVAKSLESCEAAWCDD